MTVTVHTRCSKIGGHYDPVHASLVLLPNSTSENVKPTYLNTRCTAGKVQSHQHDHHVCPASQKSCLELFLGSGVYLSKLQKRLWTYIISPCLACLATPGKVPF